MHHAAPLALPAAQTRTGNRPRNILERLSDQHRPAALNYAGNTIAQMPSLDSLAGGDHPAEVWAPARILSPASGIPSV